uniref:Uncharacterized protein n=1 Tax=Caenorhabditis japonica TaxID=281687 RepID=A0A8R1E9T6_CAEJA
PFQATVCPIVRSENASVTTYTTSDTLKTNMTPSTASPSSITTPVKSAPFSSAVVLNEKWIVEENGEKKVLPMKVYVKQRHHDGSLDLLLVYLDEHREKVMELAMNLNGDKVTNVQFCGEKMQIEKN